MNGIAYSIESDWQSHVSRLESSRHDRLLDMIVIATYRKQFIKTVMESSACLTPVFTIQSLLVDSLSSIWIRNQLTGRLKKSDEVLLPYLQLKELEYIFDCILYNAWSVALAEYAQPRIEMVTSCLSGHRLHLQEWGPYHCHCALNVATDNNTIPSPQPQSCYYLPSIDMLLLAVEPTDIECYQYLIEELHLNPNVCFYIESETKPTVEDCYTILLKPLPLKTLRYLIEVGGASLQALSEKVFNGESNLLFHICSNVGKWMQALSDCIDIVRYLVEVQCLPRVIHGVTAIDVLFREVISQNYRDISNEQIQELQKYNHS